MNFMKSLLPAWLRSKPVNPDIEKAIARTIHYIGPQLHSLPDLEARLRKPLQHALAHCQALVSALPPAIELDRNSVSRNPLAHALFPTPETLLETLGRSRQIRRFVAASPQPESEYFTGLLAVRLRRKMVMGVQLEGSLLNHDVMQTLLNFSGHVVTYPAVTDDQAEQYLREAALDSLLASFAAHVHAIRDELRQLNVERGREQAHIALLRQKQRTTQFEPHTRRIDELNEKLRNDFAALEPEHVVEVLSEHLLTPQRSLRLQTLTMRTLRNGIILPDNAPPTEDESELQLAELVSRDQRKHVVMPVRIPLALARDAVEHYHHMTARYLLL